MGKQKKRRLEKMEGSSAADVVYVFSTEESKKLKKWAKKRPGFINYPANRELALGTKMTAMRASPFVVSLVSFSGDDVLTQGCGTIIEIDDENTNTVITSLHLIRNPTKAEFVEHNLAPDLKIVVHSSDDNLYLGEIHTYDFHYNLLIIKFKSAASLQSAKLSMIDDDPDVDRSFRLRPHAVKVRHGDEVIVVGRYFFGDYDLMAAPGVFKNARCSLETLKYGCKELLVSSCKITRCGDGAPVINLSAEVIGISFYELGATTPFLPINIASKWWDHFKSYKDLRHLSYGFEGSNLYAAKLHVQEKVVRKFPHISNGMLVQRVHSGSNAETAGLREEDVITKCDDVDVKSFFQLWSYMWDKVGHVVRLEVARPKTKTTRIVNLEVSDAEAGELNKWPRYDCCGWSMHQSWVKV